MNSRYIRDAIFCSSVYYKYKDLLAAGPIQNVRVNSNNLTFLYAHQSEDKTILLKAIFYKNAFIIHSKYEHRAAQAKNYCRYNQNSRKNESEFGISGLSFRSHKFTMLIRHLSFQPDPDDEMLTACFSEPNKEFILRLVTRLTIEKLQSQGANLNVQLAPLQEAKDMPTLESQDEVFHLLTVLSTPVAQCVFSNLFPRDELMFTPDFPRLPEEDNQNLHPAHSRTCAIL